MNIENRLSKLEAKAPAEDDWKGLSGDRGLG